MSFRNSAMQGQYCKFRPRSARNIPRIFYGDEVIFIAFYSILSLNGNLFMIFASRNKASDAEIGLGGIS